VRVGVGGTGVWVGVGGMGLEVGIVVLVTLSSVAVDWSSGAAVEDKLHADKISQASNRMKSSSLRKVKIRRLPVPLKENGLRCNLNIQIALVVNQIGKRQADNDYACREQQVKSIDLAIGV